MKIIYNNIVGEIASVLHSLKFSSNFKDLKDILDSNNVELDERFLRDFQDIRKRSKGFAEKLDFYFSDGARIWKSLIHTKEMWKHSSIQDFLSSINYLDAMEIKKRLYEKINKERSEIIDEELEEVIDSSKDFFHYIKSLDIEDSHKWKLFCFTNDVSKYTKGFTDFIDNYLPYYAQIAEKYREEEEKSHEYLECQIKKSGLEFLKKVFKGHLDINKYNKVFITASIFNTHMYSYAIEDNNLYVYLGIKYIDELKENKMKNSLEDNLLVYKNISDKTRFEIMKILLSGEYFGQEIAEKLSISTAAVSYQMNYLFSANLVHIEKKDRKVFYKLNKNTLIKSIEFLTENLKL